MWIDLFSVIAIRGLVASAAFVSPLQPWHLNADQSQWHNHNCAERGEVRVVGIYQPVSSSSVLNHTPVPLFK